MSHRSDHGASIAGRSYARAYRVQARDDLVDFLLDAVAESGARLLFVSASAMAPLYMGLEVAEEERLGLLIYPFRCNPPPIKGRPVDEHRLQVRYGGERSWTGEHPLGTDVARVDVTLVLGLHLAAGIFIGLDPALYNPLPMGISVEFKQHQVDEVRADGWSVWERVNRGGTRRSRPRARNQLETVVGFLPERLIDYVKLEREASTLALDPPLRYRAAEAVKSRPHRRRGTRHTLEEEFGLDHVALLDIISDRGRLKVAVRGGVAEHHLQHHLQGDPQVLSVDQVDRDGPPDFEVVLRDGRRLAVECKNASPHVYARADGPVDAVGDAKVEVQKTRAQKGDPAGRLYRPGQFDVLAACLFASTGLWEFRFRRSSSLLQDTAHTDRIAPVQRINRHWSRTISEVH
ncbi:MAG: hypothetical protein WD794_03715 [Mycobacteriales bacterium]